MSYLGKKDGPRMSLILQRYQSVLLGSVRHRGSGPYRIDPKTIDNLIEKELETEASNIIEPINVPTGYITDPEEFYYRGYDPDTKSRVELFYKFTDEEKSLLGKSYQKEFVKMISPEEALFDDYFHEQIMGSGEF